MLTLDGRDRIDDSEKDCIRNLAGLQYADQKIEEIVRLLLEEGTDKIQKRLLLLRIVFT